MYILHRYNSITVSFLPGSQCPSRPQSGILEATEHHQNLSYESSPNTSMETGQGGTGSPYISSQLYGLNQGYTSRYGTPTPGGHGGSTTGGYCFPNVSNAGPIVPDYATAMPCNLQQRMTGQHQLPGINSLGMAGTSLEETLANLPYEAVQLKKALSNHSGIVT